MRTHRVIRRCNADRLDRAKYARLLRAVFAPDVIAVPVAMREDLPSPPIHPYSIVWALVEPDPRLWN